MSTVLEAYEAFPADGVILAVIKSVTGTTYRVSVYTTVFSDSLDYANRVFQGAKAGTRFKGEPLEWVEATDAIEGAFDKADREEENNGTWSPEGN